jgi:hypothetical protein
MSLKQVEDPQLHQRDKIPGEQGNSPFQEGTKL